MAYNRLTRCDHAGSYIGTGEEARVCAGCRAYVAPAVAPGSWRQAKTTAARRPAHEKKLVQIGVHEQHAHVDNELGQKFASCLSWVAGE